MKIAPLNWECNVLTNVLLRSPFTNTHNATACIIFTHQMIRERTVYHHRFVINNCECQQVMLFYIVTTPQEINSSTKSLGLHQQTEVAVWQSAGWQRLSKSVEIFIFGKNSKSFCAVITMNLSNIIFQETGTLIIQVIYCTCLVWLLKKCLSYNYS